MRTALPLVLLFSLVLAVPARAQAPAELSYQGYLEDGGAPVEDTDAELTFRLLDGANNVVWTETHPSDGTGIDADFRVYDKDGNVLFDVDESGTVLVNGTVVHGSDRNRKEHIEPLDGAAVLQQVRALPLYRWSYRGEAARHVGPMAQDFAAAFGLGADDRHIATVNADGVALGAVQALARQVEQQREEIATLRADLEALRDRFDRVQARATSE